MLLGERKQYWIFGVLFGAWIGGIYALVTQAVNWLALPGIPLAPPTASLGLYLLQYALLGALLGFVSAIPASRVVGTALGGFVLALLITFLALNSVWREQFFSNTLILMLCAFMPLVVLMAPLALVIRIGVDAQHIEKDRPHLWARKYIIPFLLTLLAVLLGSLSLYSNSEREAFRRIQDMIVESRQAASIEALPAPLQEVSGYLENARGRYALSWSDRLDTFLGPRPVGSELSQFLILARYQNGFAFACVFSANRAMPNCVRYQGETGDAVQLP